MDTNKIDPCITPVWALYSCDDDAKIIYGVLPKWGKRYSPILPTAMWSDGGKWTSRTGWALTKEELIEKWKIQPSCSSCAKPYGAHYTNEMELLARNLCFGCNHWLHDVLPYKDKSGYLFIEGQFYNYNAAKPLVTITNDGGGYGFGGREFLIKLHGGEIIKTNNLWSGGVIPKRFRHLFPDNASFEKWPDKMGHGQGFLG